MDAPTRSDTRPERNRFKVAAENLSVSSDKGTPAAEANNKGVRFSDNGDIELALELYDRAITLNPGLATAHLNRGNALSRLGRKEEALTSYRKAIALDPLNALYHYNFGCCLYDMGRFEEAVAAFEEAAQRGPYHANNDLNLGLSLLALGRAPEAISALQKALTIDPGLTSAKHALAEALFNEERFDEAVPAYKAILSDQTGKTTERLYLGVALGRLSRHEEAVACFAQVVDEDPQNIDALVNLGISLAALHRFDEALSALDRALAHAPGTELALVTRAAALLGLQRYEDALVPLNELAALTPDNPVSHLNIGIALSRKGDFESAWLSYLRAMQLGYAPDQLFAEMGQTIATLDDPGRKSQIELIGRLSNLYISGGLMNSDLPDPSGKDSAGEGYVRRLNLKSAIIMPPGPAGSHPRTPDALAEWLLIASHSKKLPVDVGAAAGRLGVQLLAAEMRDRKTLSVLTLGEPDTQPVLYLQEGLARGLARICLARQIWALLTYVREAGRPEQTNVIVNEDAVFHSDLAGQFATALLMPEPEFRHYAAMLNDSDALAALFDVPVDFIGVRASGLGVGEFIGQHGSIPSPSGRESGHEVAGAVRPGFVAAQQFRGVGQP